MIVIPMLGLSSRFFKAGYTQPKYQLELCGSTVFSHSVSSFRHYFETEPFVFVVRPDYHTEEFVRQEVQALAIRKFEIVIIQQNTSGQAESVYLGTRNCSPETPLTIFNIDTIRHDFEQPAWVNDCDGYLEVFKGEGTHWSFVLPGDDLKVLKTTEKDRVSDLCSNGLYHFRTRRLFDEAYLAREESTGGEYYIAPLYNRLIKNGMNIRYREVPIGVHDFCGTPDEYHHLLAATPCLPKTPAGVGKP